MVTYQSHRKPEAGDEPLATNDTSANHGASAAQLAEVLQSYAAPDAEALPMNIAQETFQEAYAFLLNAVAQDDRPALIAYMRRDLDSVAEQELAAPSVQHQVSTQQFMADMAEQERQQRQLDVATKKLLSGALLREKLQVTPQALSAALKARRLFALRGPSGEYAYPAFFADPRHDRQVLEKVSKALGSLPGAAKWDFFTVPRLSLGGKSPLDALAKGKVDAVMAAALAYADE